MYTKEELYEKSSPELVKLYNEVTGKSIKKFSTKENAVVRTHKALQQQSKREVKMDNLIVHEKPYRFNNGSMRQQCFRLIQQGMTFEEYIKAAEEQLSLNRKQAIGHLKKLMFHGLVEIPKDQAGKENENGGTQ